MKTVLKYLVMASMCTVAACNLGGDGESETKAKYLGTWKSDKNTLIKIYERDGGLFVDMQKEVNPMAYIKEGKYYMVKGPFGQEAPLMMENGKLLWNTFHGKRTYVKIGN